MTKACLPGALRALPSALLLGALCACDLGAFCQQNAPSAQGDLDRLSDVVLVTPPGEEVPERSFLLLANPEIEALRVYDTYEGVFLFAPNVFFPLTIPMGPATRKLAVPARVSARALALDAASEQVILVRTVDEGDAPAFTRAGTFATGPAPSDLAVVPAGEALRVFIALPEEGAVQVLDVDPATAAAEEVALVELSEGSRPSGLSVAPGERTLVVTDVGRPEIALIDLLDLSVARLFVGAPSGRVVTGRVDVGDGLAPVALVFLREANAVAAVRLFRPAFREDRYALLGSVELSALPTAAYVPDAAAGEEPVPVCCAGVPEENGPTQSFAAVTLATGDLVYVRLAPEVAVIDTDLEGPAVAGDLDEEDLFTAPAGGAGRRPSLAIQPALGAGEPPRSPYLPEGLAYTITYEGALPGLSPAEATLEGGVVTVTGGGPSAEALSLEAGDRVVIDTSERDGSCPDEVEASVTDLAGDTFRLGDLSSLEEGCLAQGGGLSFTAFAAGDLIVSSSEQDFFGRFFLPPPGEGSVEIEVPGLRFVIAANAQGLPLAGSRFVLPITQNLEPAGIELSALPTANLERFGFGAAARLPTSMSGGEVVVRDFDDDGAERAVVVRRTWITTSTGRLFELNLAETAATNVAERD